MKPLELKPHQVEAVKNLGNGKILVGDVGSGKSLAAVAYYLAKEAPRDIYVITTAQKRDLSDWDEEFIKLGVSRDDPRATHHGVLRVDSWNNIGKYVDVKDAFFIFDEQRLVGSGSWTKSFFKVAKNNRWILLSATPGDTWLDYIPVFVANDFYKNRTEFKRRHVVYSPFTKYPKVQRYLESGVLVRRRNSIQVLMPFERHTTRHIHNVEVQYDQELVREVMVKRWNIFKEEPMKDIADLFRVTRKIVNTDPSRLSIVRSLLEKHPRLIVFYNFDYELDLLRTLVDTTSSSKTNQKSVTASVAESESLPKSQTSTFIGTTKSMTSGSTNQTSLIESGVSVSKLESARNTPTCDECNPENPNQPCDPIIHGKEPVWKREKLSSLVSSSSLSENAKTIGVPKKTARVRPSSSILGTEPGSTGESSPNSSGMNGGRSSDSTTSSISERVETGQAMLDGLNLSHSPSKQATISKTTSEATSPGRTSGDEQIPVTFDPNRLPTSPLTPMVGSSKTLTLAEWNGHKHDPVPTTDRWVYLVQYTAGAEGWNCITTDAMCFYSLPYSYKLWHQAHGRIDRLNTLYFDLHYYVLESKSWIDLAIRKSLRGKKSFNEASWGRKVA